MSAQTGSPSVPPLAAGASLVGRLRHRLSRLSQDPNPVWMRELRQSARLQRTPVILMEVPGASGETVTQEAFIFWGPFVGFAAVVVLYVVWMFWVERGDGE